jgi:hypothetical protein
VCFSKHLGHLYRCILQSTIAGLTDTDVFQSAGVEDGQSTFLDVHMEPSAASHVSLPLQMTDLGQGNPTTAILLGGFHTDYDLQLLYPASTVVPLSGFTVQFHRPSFPNHMIVNVNIEKQLNPT